MLNRTESRYRIRRRLSDALRSRPRHSVCECSGIFELCRYCGSEKGWLQIRSYFYGSSYPHLFNGEGKRESYIEELGDSNGESYGVNYHSDVLCSSEGIFSFSHTAQRNGNHRNRDRDRDRKGIDLGQETEFDALALARAMFGLCAFISGRQIPEAGPVSFALGLSQAVLNINNDDGSLSFISRAYMRMTQLTQDPDSIFPVIRTLIQALNGLIVPSLQQGLHSNFQASVESSLESGSLSDVGIMQENILERSSEIFEILSTMGALRGSSSSSHDTSLSANQSPLASISEIALEACLNWPGFLVRNAANAFLPQIAFECDSHLTCLTRLAHALKREIDPDCIATLARAILRVQRDLDGQQQTTKKSQLDDGSTATDWGDVDHLLKSAVNAALKRLNGPSAILSHGVASPWAQQALFALLAYQQPILESSSKTMHSLMQFILSSISLKALYTHTAHTSMTVTDVSSTSVHPLPFHASVQKKYLMMIALEALKSGLKSFEFAPPEVANQCIRLTENIIADCLLSNRCDDDLAFLSALLAVLSSFVPTSSDSNAREIWRRLREVIGVKRLSKLVLTDSSAVCSVRFVRTLLRHLPSDQTSMNAVLEILQTIFCQSHAVAHAKISQTRNLDVEPQVNTVVHPSSVGPSFYPSAVFTSTSGCSNDRLESGGGDRSPMICTHTYFLKSRDKALLSVDHSTQALVDLDCICSSVLDIAMELVAEFQTGEQAARTLFQVFGWEARGGGRTWNYRHVGKALTFIEQACIGREAALIAFDILSKKNYSGGAAGDAHRSDGHNVLARNVLQRFSYLILTPTRAYQIFQCIGSSRCGDGSAALGLARNLKMLEELSRVDESANARLLYEKCRDFSLLILRSWTIGTSPPPSLLYSSDFPTKNAPGNLDTEFKKELSDPSGARHASEVFLLLRHQPSLRSFEFPGSTTGNIVRSTQPLDSIKSSRLDETALEAIDVGKGKREDREALGRDTDKRGDEAKSLQPDLFARIFSRRKMKMIDSVVPALRLSGVMESVTVPDGVRKISDGMETDLVRASSNRSLLKAKAITVTYRTDHHRVNDGELEVTVTLTNNEERPISCLLEAPSALEDGSPIEVVISQSSPLTHSANFLVFPKDAITFAFKVRQSFPATRLRRLYFELDKEERIAVKLPISMLSFFSPQSVEVASLMHTEAAVCGRLRSCFEASAFLKDFVQEHLRLRIVSFRRSDGGGDEDCPPKNETKLARRRDRWKKRGTLSRREKDFEDSESDSEGESDEWSDDGSSDDEASRSSDFSNDEGKDRYEQGGEGVEGGEGELWTLVAAGVCHCSDVKVPIALRIARHEGRRPSATCSIDPYIPGFVNVAAYSVEDLFDETWNRSIDCKGVWLPKSQSDFISQGYNFNPDDCQATTNRGWILAGSTLSWHDHSEITTNVRDEHGGSRHGSEGKGDGRDRKSKGSKKGKKNQRQQSHGGASIDVSADDNLRLGRQGSRSMTSQADSEMSDADSAYSQKLFDRSAVRRLNNRERLKRLTKQFLERAQGPGIPVSVYDRERDQGLGLGLGLGETQTPMPGESVPREQARADEAGNVTSSRKGKKRVGRKGGMSREKEVPNSEGEGQRGDKGGREVKAAIEVDRGGQSSVWKGVFKLTKNLTVIIAPLPSRRGSERSVTFPLERVQKVTTLDSGRNGGSPHSATSPHSYTHTNTHTRTPRTPFPALTPSPLLRTTPDASALSPLRRRPGAQANNCVLELSMKPEDTVPHLALILDSQDTRDEFFASLSVLVIVAKKRALPRQA